MKLWKGRLKEGLDTKADSFNSSIGFDQNMYSEDIDGSVAHAKMLGKTGIISEEEADSIVVELMKIKEDIEEGLPIDQSSEDIHTFIEGELTKRIGVTGKKLHTARSRNDQVVTDTKLYLKKKSFEAAESLVNLIKSIFNIVEENTETIMPGYTHLQAAQPVTFAHHIMAYGQMFLRDHDRLQNALKRMDLNPLGACALAGTTFPINRFYTSELLGFSGPTENSMDSVADRDYILEIQFVITLIMNHLSRLSEELILWSSQGFKFIEMSDAYSTGSSIMPQKKNPDMAELIRGKSGRVTGNLTSTLIMLKGLPLSYNKDMQEDKEGIFDSLETVIHSVDIMAGMLNTMKLNKDKMYRACQDGFINATDVADYLTKKGKPFREAYSITGEIVSECVVDSITLNEYSLEKYKAKDELFEEDIYEAIKIETALYKRNSYGGPAPEAVKVQIQNAREKLKEQMEEYEAFN
ncbi:MAG: argininosuccinate lyase [Clostridiaceae bacterium]